MSRRVVIAATFAVEPVLPGLSYWLERHQMEVELAQAPYGQVLEQVTGPESDLTAESTDLGVLLVRFEDYLRDEDGVLHLGQEELEAALRHVEELVTALTDHASAGRCPLLVGVMPSTAGDDARQLMIRGRQLLEECIATHPGDLFGLDIEGALDLYSVRQVEDPFRDEIAHVPFSEECLIAVGTTIAGQLRELWR